MEYTRPGRARTLLCLSLLSALAFEHCAPYPSLADYDIHLKAIATIAHVDYPAQLHLRLNGRSFAGYYIVELPDYRLRRTFTATPFYYQSEHDYQGEGGSSESLNFRDDFPGHIAWFECNRRFSSVIVYDQFKWDTIPHFIGIRLEGKDTAQAGTSSR